MLVYFDMPLVLQLEKSFARKMPENMQRGSIINYWLHMWVLYPSKSGRLRRYIFAKLRAA